MQEVYLPNDPLVVADPGKPKSTIVVWILISLLFITSITLTVFLYRANQTLRQVTFKLESQPTIQPSPSFPLDAQVVYVTGNAWTVVNNRRVEIKEGDMLTVGSSVSTDSKSRLSLRFDDGSVVSVDQNTQVILEQLSSQLMQLNQTTGTLFARVHKDETHQFIVNAGTVTVTALGTQFAVDKSDTVQVTVFESKVKVEDTTTKESQEVSSLQQWSETTKSTSPVIASAIAADEFLSWSLEQQPSSDPTLKPTPPATPKPTVIPAVKPAAAPATADSSSETRILRLAAQPTAEGIRFTWDAKNVEAPEGFKLVKSSDPNPVYPGHEYIFLNESGARSYVWDIQDGKQWHFRVCEYREGQCRLYSNDVTLTAPSVSLSHPTSSSVQSIHLTKVEKGDGSMARVYWDVNGSSPKGYKIAISTNHDPVFPVRAGDTYFFAPDPTTRSMDVYDLEAGKTYYFRVCEYLGGACGLYSNEVSLAF